MHTYDILYAASIRIHIYHTLYIYASTYPAFANEDAIKPRTNITRRMLACHERWLAIQYKHTHTHTHGHKDKPELTQQ
jgi:hypothetical protein